MRILLPILAFLIISFSLKAQTPIWTSAWKLNNSGYATTVDFGKDSADNFYVAGSFFNQVKFGNTTLTTNGNQDIFLVKSDDNGNVKWAINFGGTSTDLVTDIHVDDSANVIVTGSFISNFIAGTDTITPSGFSYHGYVTKIDSSGNVVWTKTASGGSIQQGKSVITDDKGYVYWAGDYFGNCKVADVSVSQASGSYDVWLAKIGPGGETIRAQGYGGSSTDQVVKLALAGKAVYMTGNFFSTNFKIGSTTISTSGSYDIWLAKFDTAFNSTYLIKGGSSNNAVVYAIDANKDGSVSLCGNYISSFTMGGRSVSGNWNDAFVTRIGANSKAIFLTDIDGGSGFGQSVFTNSILSFDDGSVLVGGYFSAQVTIDKKNFSPNGGNDVLVASFKKNGAFNWLNQGGNSNSEISVGLVADSSDHYYVAGYFSTSTKFGNISLSGSGSGINYIAKGTEPVTAPVYNGLRNRVLYVDSTFEKSFAVKPATTAQYTLLNAPTGATLTADSGYFSFTPNASQIGKHKVVIKAENLGGDAKDSFFITVIVPVDAQNQVPKYACVNEEISFDQTYTDVGPVIILWEFGDGKKKNTDREFIRSYSDTGQYVVKMMVTNWHGEKDSLIDTIYIAPLPSADFVVNTACKGDSLRLTNSSQVAKGKITSTIWSKEKVFEQANYNYIKYAANYDTSDYQLLI
ncbi:MAG: PKD domain-containing protein, partial [Bacteroidia bacterium]